MNSKNLSPRALENGTRVVVKLGPKHCQTTMRPFLKPGVWHTGTVTQACHGGPIVKLDNCLDELIIDYPNNTSPVLSGVLDWTDAIVVRRVANG